MHRLLLVLICVSLLIPAGPVKAALITFDDIPGADPSDWNNPIPNGYGGLNWDFVYVIHKDYEPGTGYQNGVVSGEWAAYNPWSVSALVSSGTIDSSLPLPLFDFTGAYFTSAWDPVNSLTITAYTGDTEAHTATFDINTTSPTWFQADWLGIDTLYFTTSGTEFVMDNFTATAPVPEPATLLLLGSGAIGLIGIRRRRVSKE